jgi:uncharacterized membrane protein
MLTFFADHFTGTKRQARKSLEEYTEKVRPKDLIGISFFGGMSLLLILIGVFFGLTPSSSDTPIQLKDSALSVLKLTFMIVYIVFGAALCTQIFTMHGINYLFILEIDPSHKMTHLTLYRVAITLFFFWAACCSLTVA